jgi:hypothetical protein
MATDISELETQTTDDAAGGDLSTVLQKIADLYEQKEEVAAREKAINERLKSLEGIASELIKVSGLDRVGASGKTWWVEETVLVSVLKDKRDEVLKAAEQEGIREELMTVQTATLKSWLIERRKKLGRPESGSFTEGTAFAGLVSELPTFRLMRRTNA